MRRRPTRDTVNIVERLKGLMANSALADLAWRALWREG
jgi:hypothetical protein